MDESGVETSAPVPRRAVAAARAHAAAVAGAVAASGIAVLVVVAHVMPPWSGVAVAAAAVVGARRDLSRLRVPRRGGQPLAPASPRVRHAVAVHAPRLRLRPARVRVGVTGRGDVAVAAAAGSRRRGLVLVTAAFDTGSVWPERAVGAIVAHELAHVTAGDRVVSAARAMTERTAGLAVVSAGVWAGFGAGPVGEVGKVVLVAVGAFAATRVASRRVEYAADALAARAGQRDALAETLERLRSPRGRQWLSTHPAPQARARRLRRGR